MSSIKPGPDWCAVIRTPTAKTWADIEREAEQKAQTQEQTKEDRVKRVEAMKTDSSNKKETK